LTVIVIVRDSPAGIEAKSTSKAPVPPTGGPVKVPSDSTETNRVFSGVEPAMRTFSASSGPLFVTTIV
jgi:hypothetical protein